MKDYTAANIRNIGVFGHGGEGKTTLTEAMLFNAGLTERLGRVDSGTTTTDFDPEEVKRSISINAALAPLEWKDVKINLIDAPGFFDFYGEVTAAMLLADSALIVVGAVSGLVVGTEKAMDMCKKANKPRMMVINQMDRENANFTKVMEEINAKFGPSVVPIQLPIMEGGAFVGYVDLASMTARKFDGKGEKEIPMPASLDALAKKYYEALTEAAAESDEELMEKFFEEGELSREDMLKGLGKGVKEGTVTPVCCCAAMPNIGVAALTDNLVHYLPAASECKAPKAVSVKTGEAVEVKRDGRFAAQVIKTVVDQFGKYSIVKVYSGALDAATVPYNSNAEKSEKPGTVYIMRGKKAVAVDKLVAGDIGALSKLQFTATGDTLCDAANPVRFAPIEFPKPAIALAVSAKKQGEEDKVFAGLNKLLDEDPTIALEKNGETGDVLLWGLGEVHLDVVCSKLRNKTGVEAQLTDPRIPYRETIRGTAEAEGKHKKQTGGSGQFGVVNMRFEPLEGGEEFEFVNAIVGGVVPREFIPAVEKGTREAMRRGVLAGYPMTGVKATLFFGKYHPVDSKEVAFKSAARLAYKEACAHANPALIEPIYRYEIHVPSDYVGDVIGDLNRRRGRMLGMNPGDEGTVVVAEAPLSEMFKYATDLRSMTQARGSFTSEFVRYEDVPALEAKKIIDSAKKEEEEEE
ncbi:MAG: Elongation factor G [Firmicutes bacterium ADurb.Bin248]|nr:MAG: Elongation factor G [Firmicutes bacterium ADurb.Bin248]HOG00944.1 elongation factor G [Clostridia bacterium]